MRKCIKPCETVGLSYLASSELSRSLEIKFCIGRKTISRMIIDVSKAIFEIIRSDFFRTPRKKEEWLVISKKIDRKHIVIEQPINS